WGAATTVASNGLYVIGGTSSGIGCTSTVFRLPASGGSWSTMTAMPVASCQATATTLFDQVTGAEFIVVTGGISVPNPRLTGTPTLLANTYVYNVSANSWSSFSAAPS